MWIFPHPLLCYHILPAMWQLELYTRLNSIQTEWDRPVNVKVDVYCTFFSHLNLSKRFWSFLLCFLENIFVLHINIICVYFNACLMQNKTTLIVSFQMWQALPWEDGKRIMSFKIPFLLVILLWQYWYVVSVFLSLSEADGIAKVYLSLNSARLGEKPAGGSVSM